MDIRLFHPSDGPQIAQLFHDTIHHINSRDYSREQVQAWAPNDLNFRDWQRMDRDRFTAVAEEDGVIIGFAELELRGHLDCFYCHHQYQRRGIGRQLYEYIEAQALGLGLTTLTTAASITAKPFFESMGFMVLAQKTVTRRGQTFTNFAMQKSLLKSNGESAESNHGSDLSQLVQ